MELAQSKALNSYSFRDCMNWLTQLWQHCYERIAQIDEGFYSTTVQLTEKLTTLPPFVRNTVRIYASRDIIDAPRQPYKQSSMTDIQTPLTFHISGNDVLCPDVARGRWVWCEYTPEPPFITFTKNNRDPKLITPLPTDNPILPQRRYGGYMLEGNGTTALPYVFRSMHSPSNTFNVQHTFVKPGYTINALILDHPYVFISYEDNATKDWSSWILKDILDQDIPVPYNPFDFQGRPSQVRYIKAKWNDYTGMGVVIEDQLDQDAQGNNRIKELGWTPDTIMHYPSPIMRNYLVANLASKFADLNGAQLTAVDNEVASASYQMANFLDKNKSAWVRMDRTTPRTLGDLL